MPFKSYSLDIGGTRGVGTPLDYRL